MKILNVRTIAGPNIYHNRPVLILTLDLEDLAEVSSDTLSGFTQRLSTLLPGLTEHRCSPGYPGGFIERLNRGTYFAHIVEHIALEISEVAGIGVGYGKSIYGDAPGIYQIIVRYKNEQGMIEVLKTAVKLADAVAHNQPFDLASCVEEIKKRIQKTAFGPSTQAILEAATTRNIPWRRLNELNMVQLGYGKYRKFIQATTSSLTSDIAVEIAQDKELTKKFLRNGAIKVPYGKVTETLEEVLEAFSEFSVPVVVKPFDGNHGRGVSINLKSPEEVSSAFEIAKAHSRLVIIEEYLKGLDYRIVVVGGKMIAASLRDAAHVYGDGIHKISELIDRENLNPLRGEGHEKPLTKILMDPSSESVLLRNQLTLDLIPAKGEKVYLRETANISTGGTATDVTDFVHEEIKMLCERAAKIIGLDICGIDLIIEDISKPLEGQSGGVIEVNAGPGIRMHHYPSLGKKRDVAGAIIDHLYPGNQNGRIPIISVTGTNGKTTVTRIIGHIIGQSGITVGSTTTDGIYLNNRLVAEGDTTGPLSAQNLLFDPSVELAVFETARGGIKRKGLGYDWADVGIITNVTSDHIGQDGILTMEDIVKIKSLIVERVRYGGNVILNADDPELVRLAKKPEMEIDKKNLIYFSIQENSNVIREHVANGGTALYLKKDKIFHAYEGIERFIIDAKNIPLTINGTALFHVANCLASIAACKSIGLPTNLILEGLISFDHNLNNRGRTNLYKINNGFVLLDYAHNPEALLNIGDMVKKWDVTSFTGVITAPGDRSDDLIRMSGIAAAHVFNKIIIREDSDLRGRQREDVARLILEGVNSENTHLKTHIVLEPEEALVKSVHEMTAGEIVAYFYEDFNKIENLLLLMGADKVDFTFLAKKSFYSFMEEQSWQQH